MTRFPAFATALAVHAAVFVTLVVLPVFTSEPLPETGATPSLLPAWPLPPRVALADARPKVAPARGAGPRRTLASATPSADEGAPPAPVFDLKGTATDETSDVPIDTNTLGTRPADAASADRRPSAIARGDAAGAGGGSGGGPLQIERDLRPPAKLHHVPPRYPELAIRARVSGTVEIDCLIDESGRVTSVLVRSGHPLLAPAATDAVRQWAYSPTWLNGKAVAVGMTVSVRFELLSRL